MPGRKGNEEYLELPRLHQDKKCQYCSKEFNTSSTHWKKFCSRQCQQNQYVFNKTGRKPMSHAQVSSQASIFFGQNDEHNIHTKSFIFNDLQQNKISKALLYSTSLVFASFVIRTSLALISPISNGLLRANRFLVEREVF